MTAVSSRTAPVGSALAVPCTIWRTDFLVYLLKMPSRAAPMQSCARNYNNVAAKFIAREQEASPCLCARGQARRSRLMKRFLHRTENDERPGPSRATHRPQTDRTASNHRGRGVLDRWIDFGGAVGGARRIGLFPGRRSGLYARRPPAPDGHSRRGDEGHPLLVRTIRKAVGEPDTRALFNHLGAVRNRSERARRQSLRRRARP